jgi:hypothetical protein
VNELSALVQRRLRELGDGDRPMSYKRAADRSRGKVSHEIVRQIASGVHSGRISDRIAEGLALALEVPLTMVHDIARIPRPQSRWHWPERFDRLDPAQRKLVEELAGALLEAYEKGLGAA